MLGRLFKGGSDNEFGATLPDEEAQLCEESEIIYAYNAQDAKKKCKDLAEEYGGTDSQATHTENRGEYDCKFKLWR